MEGITEELEAVQSVYIDDLSCGEEEGKTVVKFSVEGHHVLTLKLTGEKGFRLLSTCYCHVTCMYYVLCLEPCSQTYPVGNLYYNYYSSAVCLSVRKIFPLAGPPCAS